MDHINRIDPCVLNCSLLQLNYNLNNPTNSEMNFWGKKGELFQVTGIYWHLQRLCEVCLRKKLMLLWLMTSDSPLDKMFTLQKHWYSNIFPRWKRNFYSNLSPIIEGAKGLIGSDPSCLNIPQYPTCFCQPYFINMTPISIPSLLAPPPPPSSHTYHKPFKSRPPWPYHLLDNQNPGLCSDSRHRSKMGRVTMYSVALIWRVEI